MDKLDGVVISEGPGSYTALRVGASVAKAISYALSIPLIGVSSLEALCYGAEKIEKDSIYLPTIDARRMEIYAALYDFEYKELKTTHTIILTEKNITLFDDYKKVYVLGDGSEKTVSYFNHEKIINTKVIPRASNLISLGLKKYKSDLFEDLHKFEPKYFKAPNITKPKPIL
jgi:tRNA threonylcarbamoyladenosine biosynthesis protein TsaB